MKKIITILAVAGLAALQTSVHAQIIFTEAFANSEHPGGAGNGDWFEIYNAGASAQDLTDWSWDDDDATPGVTIFPSISLAAGQIALIVDENTGNISDWATEVWGFTLDGTFAGTGLLTTTNVRILTEDLFTGTVAFSGLGASGDTLNLYDASDNLVDSFATGDQSGSNGGFSFAAGASGNSLGRSSIGVNGAFQAIGDGDGDAGVDVASPGVVIPEPGSIVLLTLGVMTGILRRHRKS